MYDVERSKTSKIPGRRFVQKYVGIQTLFLLQSLPSIPAGNVIIF